MSEEQSTSNSKAKDNNSKTKKTKDTADRKLKETTIKKLDPDSAKLLKSINDKVNKKAFGQKVKDSEIIFLGLSLIGDEHIETLKEKSIRGKDRQLFAYEKYQKENGKISFDDYLNKVFSGEILISSGN